MSKNLVRNFADNLVYYEGTYKEGPEALFEQTSISYGDLHQKRPYGGREHADYIELVLVEEATGSDYSGGTYTKANQAVFLAIAEEEGLLGTEVWEVRGGYGTYGIALLADSDNEALIDALRSLADYPVLDDDAQTEFEHEAQEEAWEDWGRNDFLKALQAQHGFDEDVADFLSTEESENALVHKLYELFHYAMEESNEYWTEETGGNMYIDMDRVVRGVDVDQMAELEAAARKEYALNEDAVLAGY